MASLLICFLAVSPVAADQTVTLAWDRNIDADVVGYRLYFGAASRGYTNSLDVKNESVGTITGLREGITYYFAVTAYAADGLESLPSDEVAYLVPGFPGSQVALNDTETVVYAAPEKASPILMTYEVVHSDPVPVLFPVSLKEEGPRVSISSIGNPAVAVLIQFEPSENKVCELQATKDFLVWESLVTFVAQSISEPVEYVDWAGGADKKFYRLLTW